MNISVEHSAFPWREKRVVFVERRVFRCGALISCDRKALTPEDAMRLARIIRDPGSEFGSFSDALTGADALDDDFSPCEYYNLVWRRAGVRDATDSLWDTDWPEAWADEIEKAAKGAGA